MRVPYTSGKQKIYHPYPQEAFFFFVGKIYNKMYKNT